MNIDKPKYTVSLENYICKYCHIILVPKYYNEINLMWIIVNSRVDVPTVYKTSYFQLLKGKGIWIF